VPVVVANAAGIQGAAAKVTHELSAAGWDLLTPTNASTQETASTVYYMGGRLASAQAIAASLGLPSTAVAPYTSAVPLATVGSAQIIVIVGPALATASPPVTTPTVATTTTTTKSTTTTTRAH
jgi:hypothetical protein